MNSDSPSKVEPLTTSLFQANQVRTHCVLRLVGGNLLNRHGSKWGWWVVRSSSCSLTHLLSS